MRRSARRAWASRVLRAPAAALAVLAAAGAALLLAGCASERSPSAAASPPRVELRVSAATSLKRAFDAETRLFERREPARLVCNFGASGTLQKQIEAGAPADVFASADPEQMDALVDGGLVSAEEVTTFASNTLVVVVPAGNPKGVSGPADLTRAERLTTGDPAKAPHGATAKAWLELRGLWVRLAPRFVFAENAAQTVDYVARGEADAAIVYASEVRAGPGAVEVAFAVPREETPPIRYVAAPLKGTKHPELARAFVRHLLSDEGQARLGDAGFRTLSE